MKVECRINQARYIRHNYEERDNIRHRQEITSPLLTIFCETSMCQAVCVCVCVNNCVTLSPKSIQFNWNTLQNVCDGSAKKISIQVKLDKSIDVLR